MQADAIQSPETYIYQCSYYGKSINPIKLNMRWKEYTKQIYMRQLVQACKSTGCIAVHSGLLSRSEREKYKEQRYYCDKKVFYLFSAESVPLDIYCKLSGRDEQLIYEQGDEEV